MVDRPELSLEGYKCTAGIKNTLCLMNINNHVSYLTNADQSC